mmetsp:Transcript_36636/g.88785  ORF Transcript_36636/g.88785 Transcript_36636/m.88785 type:complete len:200 (+) Transcript_36636:237-836(+)|eukprot:CAMPEP_0113623082 /NCGR_PEP_ID=MMETSP0017_2-20120614/11864_1 /TAXON_ID=2856 /ORGANISM="Cylindrotheca closterium" /LENGTH=199 /DNA_ID=CAMNT_0000533001 /DNA_START=242 /DNA_END=841 /DNA_ORIENTATION=+ /assembly_acc=CAM_ASM_000147
MGRRNSLSNLINLQRFRHHHNHNHSNSNSNPTVVQPHKQEEDSTQPVKEVKHVRSPSSSTFVAEDDESTVYLSCLNNKMLRRHSTGSAVPASKSVRFGDCQIRSYPQVLGDHPYCSMGCPIELGWEYNKEEVQPINDFEEQRDHQRRRSKEGLLLSPEERRSILTLSSEKSDVCAIRKACRRQCTRKAQRKIQREFFAN